MWARLMPSGEWEVKPDLRGFRLVIVLLDLHNYIFTGNSWRALPEVVIDDPKLRSGRYM